MHQHRIDETNQFVSGSEDRHFMMHRPLLFPSLSAPSREWLIAALTGAVAGASLLAHDVVSGPVPCSGARRRDKVLYEVSAAILGDAVAENNKISGG